MKRITTKRRPAQLQGFLDSGLLGYRSQHQSTVLAGGAVRTFINDEEPKDFDLFIVGIGNGDAGDVKSAVLNQCDSQYENTFRCPQGLLYSYKTPFGKVQLVVPRDYTSVGDLLDSFDLSPCRAAFDGDFVYLDRQFVHSVKKRVCKIHRVSYPLATMNRIYKYRGYGYSILDAQEELIRSIRDDEFTESDLFRHYID